MNTELIETCIEVLNAPNQISNRYVVARMERYKGVLSYWYYGNYEDRESAEDVASSLGNGIVIERREKSNG